MGIYKTRLDLKEPPASRTISNKVTALVVYQCLIGSSVFSYSPTLGNIDIATTALVQERTDRTRVFVAFGNLLRNLSNLSLQELSVLLNL